MRCIHARAFLLVIRAVQSLQREQKESRIFGTLKTALQYRMENVNAQKNALIMYQLELFELEAINKPQMKRRDRRLRTLNLDLIQGIDFTKTGIPIVKPCYHSKAPSHWQLFTQAMSERARNVNAGVMFYQDDYKIDRIWNNLRMYGTLLKRFPYVSSPDYSLYADMPIVLQRFNTYRNRLVAAYLQNKNINVVPTISWSTEESYEFCFDGLNGGTVMISTVGVLRNKKSKELWCNGVNEMINRVRPNVIIIYGRPIGFDFHNVDVTYIDYIQKKGGVSYGR